MDDRESVPEAHNKGTAFQVTMAILIAMVTVISAIIAWRAAVLSNNAANADFAGVIAVVHREEAMTTELASGYGRYRAYTDYVIDTEIANGLVDEADDSEVIAAQLAESRNNLVNNASYFWAKYIDENGNYDLDEDVKSAVANANLRTALDPQPFYEAADAGRRKVNVMVANFILLAIALLCFTTAEALYYKRVVLRYLFGGIGLINMFGGIVLAILTEIR